MVTAILLLLVLFLAGFINIYFYLPYKKLCAWLQSFFFKNNNTTAPSTTKVVPSNCQASKQEKVTSLKNYDDHSHKKGELKSVFATFDKNGDGFITKQELKDSLKNIRIFVTDKEVEEMVMKVDSNGDGLIDFEEFCLLCESLAMASPDQEGDTSFGDKKDSSVENDQEVDLKEAFDVFDRDKDGLISVEELGLVLSSLGLKEGRRVEDCKEMIKKVDMDGDGMVNFDEFKKMMRSGNTKLIHVF